MQLTYKNKHMPDKALELTINGQEVLATRHNTAMFTFLGDLACYDHVFICVNEEEGSGAYLFKNQQIWRDLAGFIMENQFPMHLNLPEVAECDVDAFNGTFYGDIRHMDSFPADWAEKQ